MTAACFVGIQDPIGVDPGRLDEIARDLRLAGLPAEVSRPGANDPLDGALRVSVDGIDRIAIEGREGWGRRHPGVRCRKA